MSYEVVACKIVAIAESPTIPTTPSQIPWWAIAVAGGILLISLSLSRRRY